MPIISAFCKKGGVGKTTFLGYLAHYHASQGKTVLIISADDQNSIFKIFGVDNFVTDRDDDFFEHLLVGEKQPRHHFWSENKYVFNENLKYRQTFS